MISPRTGALGAETILGRDAPFVARDQTGQRERHIQCVLNVVIGRIDSVIIGLLA